MNNEVLNRMTVKIPDSYIELESLPSCVKREVPNTEYGHFVSRCIYNGIDLFNIKDLSNIDRIASLFTGRLRDAVLRWKYSILNTMKYYSTDKFKFIFKQ